MKNGVNVICICLLIASIMLFMLTACGEEHSDTSSAENTAIKEAELATENATEAAVSLALVKLELHPEYERIIKDIVAEFPWVSPDWPKIEGFKLSLMYVRHDDISEIGCALIDVDGNGQEELIISDVDSNVVYDMFTIKDDKAVQILSGHERNSYRLYTQGIVDNSWSGSAVVSGHDFYEYQDGELIFLERITLDAYYAYEAGIIAQQQDASEDNSFFRSTTKEEKDYQHISSDVALNLINDYQNNGEIVTIEYISISDLFD